MPAPNETDVTSLMNPPPRRVSGIDCPGAPVTGERLLSVGGGLVTWKQFEYDPVPNALLTETSLKPTAAEALIVIFTVRIVGDVCVMEFTLIPEPEKLTPVPAISKFVPVMVTFIVLPRVPTDGDMLTMAGTGIGTPAVQDENESIPLRDKIRAPASTDPPTLVHVEPFDL